MSEKLGPLPKPDSAILRYGKQIDHFTADQMQAYAAQEVAKELERCAKRLNDTAADYRTHAKKQDQYLAARFAAYATALDDAAEDIRKMQS